MTSISTIIRKMGRACSTHWGDREIRSEFWSIKLKITVHLEDLGVDGKIILQLNLKKQGGTV
jgi:hypothetical protein